MFKLSIGPYLIQVERGTLPPLYAEYTKRAILTEEFDLRDPEREHCFVSVSRATDWPQLIVAPSCQEFRLALSMEFANRCGASCFQS